MQYGNWNPCRPCGLRERRAYLHPVWGDSGFEYRWRDFGVMRWIRDRLRREVVIEQTTDLDKNIVQSVQRRDGSDYSRVIRA